MNVRTGFVFFSILILILTALIHLIWEPIKWTLIFTIPLILIGFYDLTQKSQTILRNYPVLGHIRYLLEAIRPEIMQYFVETDTQGRPINRMFRSLIYQRAKDVTDTVPFGTQMDVYRSGYEWMDHSMYAIDQVQVDSSPRIRIGNKHCTQPYSASLLNVSAMSYGSLSKNAVLALNKGAKIGGFALNTGEGSISPFHLEFKGDLIWQIGTGYFGCRTNEGDFCPDSFEEKAAIDSVKMIEIKVSQGAKPGHGGILPASKNTPEIAAIRGVDPYIDVHSPPSHSVFSNPTQLIEFISLLRERSHGKPVGFKLCIGKKQEFVDICKAMLSSGITPDFITIDGGEGGTGAAPVEFSNSLGVPLRDGLAFAYDTLVGYGLKDEIKLIASGKIFTGFHIARALALGADMVNCARAMMMAIGCIQALECNANTCPVGVATQNKSLISGLDVNDKSTRVANFHRKTLKSFTELIAASGLSSPDQLRRQHINRRLGMNLIKRYDEIFPYSKENSLL
jgi:glutamate synthase domain-containing protein 2